MMGGDVNLCPQKEEDHKGFLSSPLVEWVARKEHSPTIRVQDFVWPELLKVCHQLVDKVDWANWLPANLGC
jgi:hypothetical protein